MKLKSEFVNAVKLFLLLCLLFWSFTWNLSEDFDFSRSESRTPIKKNRKDVSWAKSDVTVLVNQHSVLIESFSRVKYGSRKSSKSVSTTSGILIPSFNEWKQNEMTKYEKDSPKDPNSHHHRKLVRRKLNYASSKCGAKILASNPETRHRIAVLSEKSDEYLLNPCRVRTWFIIELCDTVEATHVELANYELYSSSPREFSVFWSEVYPTMVWHLLGTFEAKDQRTMQTFDVSTKNLGKFIKVIIYNHHGKEHYCPLSMIRVLGYSMVQKLEDIEDEDYKHDSDNQAEVESDKNVLSKTVQVVEMDKPIVERGIKKEFRHVSNISTNLLSVKICALFFMHCTGLPETKPEMLCTNEPLCRFLIEVMKKSSTNCYEVFCSKVPEASYRAFNTTYQLKSEDISTNLTFSVTEKSKNKTVFNRKRASDFFKYHAHKKRTKISKDSYDYVPDMTSAKYTGLKPLRRNSSVTKIPQSSKNISVVVAEGVPVKSSDSPRPTNDNIQQKCVCGKEKKSVDAMSHSDSVAQGKIVDELTGSDDAIDSAGLIQKESVLFKLTARIKSSEMDLSLINKYLQQLSQAYRQQMEDMKTMFNQTVMAIGFASEKATSINKKQEETINDLKDKMKVLNQTIDYLIRGQRDILKRVVELHAFFLILEFITISTIFTIFLNIFQRKNASFNDRIHEI